MLCHGHALRQAIMVKIPSGHGYARRGAHENARRRHPRSRSTPVELWPIRMEGADKAGLRGQRDRTFRLGASEER
jgi:hypothetical protein